MHLPSPRLPGVSHLLIYWAQALLGPGHAATELHHWVVPTQIDHFVWGLPHHGRPLPLAEEPWHVVVPTRIGQPVWGLPNSEFLWQGHITVVVISDTNEYNNKQYQRIIKHRNISS